tara:strand:- start:77 stop:196 length:120 start_codon:yes stop_codon:yes gene_type:complete
MQTKTLSLSVVRKFVGKNGRWSRQNAMLGAHRLPWPLGL